MQLLKARVLSQVSIVSLGEAGCLARDSEGNSAFTTAERCVAHNVQDSQCSVWVSPFSRRSLPQHSAL